MFLSAQEDVHDLLHQRPQPEPTQHAPGSEVSPEAAQVAPQGQAPHHPTLQTPAREQLRTGLFIKLKLKSSYSE